jgi:hypothetical protein
MSRAEDSAYLSTARSERRRIGSTSSQPRAHPLPGHNLRRTGICAEVNLWETSGYDRPALPGSFLGLHRTQPQILLGSLRLKHFLSPRESARTPNTQPKRGEFLELREAAHDYHRKAVSHIRGEP